jgi:dolichyl-phosphate beta-glucosyltransferase
MLLGRGRFLLFSDADLATPIEEITPLKAALDAGHDLAIASRGLARSNIEVHESWLRETLGKTFNLFIRTFIMGGIRDTQCGFKLFKREVVKPIFERQTVERWGFDVELLLVARRLGYSIAEVPVRWIHSFDTRIHTGFDGIRMVLDAIRIKWRHRKLRPGS